MKKSNFFLLIFFFFISIKSANASTDKYVQAQYIMGTIYKIEIYSDNKSKANQAFNQTFSEIRKCDLILSNYRTDSELTKVLDEAYSHPVKISDYFFEVTERSLYFSKITDEMFDITIEPLVNLWGFKNKDFHQPSDLQVQTIKNDIGYKNIILDKKNKTIFLKSSKIKLDFGGIGKGFAVGKAANILKKCGIKSGVIDAVSSQYYIGSPPKQKFWKVGIKNPRNPNKIIKYLYLKDMSLSTSGDYEQFFIKKGHRYSHTINPKTGYPIKEENISSTIIYSDATDSDALSSSVRLLDEQKTKNILKLFPNIQIIKIKNIDGKLGIIIYK